MNPQLKTLLYPAIIALLILISLSDCSVIKHFNKEKTKETDQINTESTITRTITETATTTIETPSVSLEGSKAADLILAGDSILEETPDLEIVTKEVKGIIETRAIKKAKEIPVNVDKVTIEKETIQANETDKKQTDTKIKDVERKGINLNYIWWLLLLLLIPIWKYRKWFLG